MIISLSGGDGSGKTTLGNLIKEKLEKRGYTVIYRTEFNYFLLKYVTQLFGMLISNEKVEEIRLKTILHNKRGIIFYTLPYLVYLDLLFEFIYIKIFKRKCVIIMDRHIIDFIVGWRLVGNTNKIIESILLNFPPADCAIFLTTNPNIAYGRKKYEEDNDLDFFVKIGGWYKELASKRQYKWFDTSGDVSETLNEILTYCNSQISHRSGFWK